MHYVVNKGVVFDWGELIPNEIVDDYNCVRHPPGHKPEREPLEMGVWFLSETELERSDSLLLTES
jgi:hypothetical protein